MITLRVDALAYDVARPYRPVHEVQGGGVNREHIGPFERHPARPELIEARAADLQRLAEQGLWQELVTNRAFTPATAAWQGLVAPELAHAPVPLQRAVADSCEALMWAALVLRLWAHRVREFNRIVADLARRWPVPPGWRPRIGSVPVPLDPDLLRQSLLPRPFRAELERQWHQAHQRLIEQGADEAVAMLRRGPTVAALRRAYAAGLLPGTGSWAFFGARWQARLAPQLAADLAARIVATRHPDLALVEGFAEVLAAHGDDPAVAGFLRRLPPADLYRLLANLAGMSDLRRLDPATRRRWRRALAAVQTGLGIALATASTGPVGAAERRWLAGLTAYGRSLVAVYPRAGGDASVPVEVYGYQLLGPLLHHGSYDADFLAHIGGDLIDFELSRGGSDVWLRHHGRFYLDPALPGPPGPPPEPLGNQDLAALRLDVVHGWDGGPHGFDPVVGLASAMARQPDGARAVLTGRVTDQTPGYAAAPPGGVRLPRLDYLLTDRQWPVDVVGPLAEAQRLRDPGSDYVSPGLELFGRALRHAVTVAPDARAHRIVESIVYEVANDEQRWGYPNDPTGQGRQLGHRATSFEQVTIVHPALRPALGEIAAHHIDDLHWAVAGELTPPEHPLPTPERPAEVDRATLRRDEAQVFLAELGKDPRARATVLFADTVYSGLLYERYLGGDAGQGGFGDRLDAAYAATTLPAAQVAAALDVGAAGEAIRDTAAADAAHNELVRLGYLLGELVTEAVGRRLPVSTLVSHALEQSTHDRFADHTGVANQRIGEVRDVSRELLAAQLEEAIYRHTPRERLRELGLLHPPDHPRAGEPVPRSRWEPGGPQERAWHDHLTGPAAHEALLALQRSRIDYNAAYAGARDDIAHTIGLPG